MKIGAAGVGGKLKLRNLKGWPELQLPNFGAQCTRV